MSSHEPVKPAVRARASHHAGIAASTAKDVGPRAAAGSAFPTGARDPRAPRSRAARAAGKRFAWVLTPQRADGRLRAWQTSCRSSHTTPTPRGHQALTHGRCVGGGAARPGGRGGNDRATAIRPAGGACLVPRVRGTDGTPSTPSVPTLIPPTTTPAPSPRRSSACTERSRRRSTRSTSICPRPATVTGSRPGCSQRDDARVLRTT